MSIRLANAVGLAVLVLVVAGCSGSSGPTLAPSARSSAAATPAPSASAAPATLLIKVTSEGGFINPSATLAALPTVTVYADGRILTPAVVAADPPPLVATIDVRDVGPAGGTAILAAIKEAGLDRPSSAAPGIPGDSGTNVFTVVVDGATTTTRFAGGGQPGPSLPGRSGGGDPAGQAALALLSRLVDPAEDWGATAAHHSSFVPLGYRVYVAPGPSADASASQAPIAWPLAASLDGFGTPAVPDRGVAGLRQGVVVGPDATQLAQVLRAATTGDVFTSGGKPYTLWVRPLLPDEIGG
jgi:hypothetical protein